MSDDRDLYRVLGVPPTASPEEVRRAHRSLVRVLHPDRHVEATEAERHLAERRMREINEAWNTLRDPGRRASYDATRRRHATTSRPSQGSPGTRRPPGSAPSRGWGSPPPHRGPRPSTAGHGAYWSPPGSGAGPGPGAQDDLEEVHPGTFFLFRRGPLLVALVVVLGLFVVTAYVGGGDDGGTVSTPPLDACVALVDGGEGYLVSCESPNDGEVVAQVDKALDCPEETRYVQVGTEFFCIPEGGEG